MLLEKPIGPTWDECVRLRDGLPENAPPVLVAHVLRYAPYTRVLRSLIAEGAVGEIINIHHLEPVGFWHFAHSFTRGNWSSTATAAPFMVSKACHDVDWVTHLIGSECVAVASFGSLKHFRPEMRPVGAADRCMDCGVACDYDAKRIYLDMAEAGDFSFPVSTIVEESTVAAVEHALAHGPHGRCVYGCDNDAVDTQVASLLFEGGETATITVSAFTEARGRHSVIAGTRCGGHGDRRGRVPVLVPQPAQALLSLRAGLPERERSRDRCRPRGRRRRAHRLLPKRDHGAHRVRAARPSARPCSATKWPSPLSAPAWSTG